jgi:outer membrane protein assembly factor BamA
MHHDRAPAADAMKRFCIGLTCFLSSVAFPQQEISSPSEATLGMIDTILVAGNEKTKSYVILDEMTLKPGMVATRGSMEFDRNRIYSLGLFTSVDLLYDSLGTTRFLFVEVRERWYVVPFPIFGFRDGDPKRVYYGAGLLHNNVGGRNQKLSASLTLGYDPSVRLAFLDPLLGRRSRLFGALSAVFSRQKNKSEREADLTGDYSEDYFEIDGTLGRRFSLYQTAGITLGYSVVAVPEYFPGRTVEKSGQDRFLSTTVAYTYDSRDLAEYASRGYLAATSITQNGLGESSLSYLRSVLDLRAFLPLPERFTLAMRGYGSLVSGGEVPIYGHAYFGYSERIRGFFRDVSEGEDLFLSSAELRFSLLSPRTIRVSGLPLPEEFTVWRFGISLALFADAGTTWNRGDHPGLRDLASGVGGGLHILLPYSVVIRIEYARNSAHRGQWILDFRGAI